MLSSIKGSLAPLDVLDAIDNSEDETVVERDVEGADEIGDDILLSATVSCSQPFVPEPHAALTFPCMLCVFPHPQGSKCWYCQSECWVRGPLEADPVPTASTPGSREKVEVLERRAQLHMDLFRLGDADLEGAGPEAFWNAMTSRERTGAQNDPVKKGRGSRRSEYRHPTKTGHLRGFGKSNQEYG